MELFRGVSRPIPYGVVTDAYRAIRPGEVPAWRQFQEYCFHTAPPEFDPWIASNFQIEHTRSLFAEGGQMAATCANYPRELYFHGARLGMGAIASVASLPENRRGGHVGRMLHHVADLAPRRFGANRNPNRIRQRPNMGAVVRRFVRPDQAVATGRLAATDVRSLDLLAAATAGEEMFFFEFF